MSITSILNNTTGEEILVLDIFKQNHIDILDIRRKCKESIIKNKPEYVCFMCKQQVYLKGESKTKKQHFAHMPKSKNCIWKTDNEHLNIEEQRKMFERVRESELHKELKNFIGLSLKKTTGFKNTKIEQRYIDKENETYKVPDVRTTLIKDNREIDIVFEIQLTSTYLDVIIERENFYYENGVIIIWVFADFSKDLSKTRMTEDDILFSNKKNVFILDSDAKSLSIEKESLHLKNLHMIPQIDSKTKNITNNWSSSELYSVKEITFDSISGKAYIYNYEKERTKLLFKKKLENEYFKKFYREIVAKIEQTATYGLNSFDEVLIWGGITENLEKDFLKKLIKAERLIRYILEVLYIGKEKKVDGVDIIYDSTFRHKKTIGNPPVQLLNHIINMYPTYMNVVLKAIDFYGKSEIYINLDKKGNMIKNINNYKLQEHKMPVEHLEIIQYLFPELFYMTNIPKVK